jgi:dihydroorotate dehydrogenase subfamily 2
MTKRTLIYAILLFSILGIVDAGYLTREHYATTITPCSTHIFIDCGAVLKSEYAVVFGVPLAVLGLIYYSTTLLALLYLIVTKAKIGKYLLVMTSSVGLVVSLYLMYLQIFVIGSICLYCTGSAIISTLLFFLIQNAFSEERKRLFIKKTWYFYKILGKNTFFLFDPEFVHNFVIGLGASLGRMGFVKKLNNWFINQKDETLHQTINGIHFENPVGLAAGFDYEARITQLLPSLGFGFETVGTVTNMPYEGNPTPRLGRLPKSKSLMVNKGFKSTGAEAVSSRLKDLNFDFPLGISIGRTNSAKLKTHKDSIRDIISAFKTFEKAKVKSSFYELNISCPNLIHGDVDFYSSKSLEDLLIALDKLKIRKPIFVKMPIEKSNKKVLAMLEVIVKHNIAGVIFGNLQKDKKNKNLDKDEVKRFKAGYFSGKPTYDRSNELISLTYKKYKSRLTIIGCGGIFNAQDALEKISRGASIVQLITGLIYEGPQLAQQINFELGDAVKKRGFKNISEFIGSSHK